MADIVLGKYDYRENGIIYLHMGFNMQYETAINTQIHEMNHMHLDNMTTLGMLLKLLEIERINTPEEDDEHKKEISKFESIIRSRTSEVQEIYANCIELLLINKLGGNVAEDNSYKLKNRKYKEYCDYLKFIVDDTSLMYIEKHSIINMICFYSMSIDISADELLKLFINKNDLIYFLENQNNTKKRLLYALECYRLKNTIELEEVIRKQEIIEIVLKFTCSRLFKYTVDYADEVRKMQNLSKDTINYWTDKYQEHIESHIKVFDLNQLHVIKDDKFFENDNDGIYIIKNCENLEYAENYYIIGHGVISNKPTYVSIETMKSKLKEIIDRVKCICISSHEYNFKKMVPIYLQLQNKPLVVMFDDYQECIDWVKKDVVEDDYYVGDLYEKNINNFFTVLFFANRLVPNTLFVYPTTKILAIRILNELPVTIKTIYSKENEFLTILSLLGDKISMMQSMQWLFAFLTDSKGNYDVENDMAAKLSYDIVVNIFNSSLNLLEYDDYKFKYVQPTVNTIAEPFYTLMFFRDNINTGKICTPDNKYIFIFSSRDMAKEWKNKYYSQIYKEGKATIVGIDSLYWRELEKRLVHVDIEIMLCLKILPTKNKDICKQLKINEVNKIINSHK